MGLLTRSIPSSALFRPAVQGRFISSLPRSRVHVSTIRLTRTIPSALDTALRSRKAPYSSMATFKIPTIQNEPNKMYEPKSLERIELENELKTMRDNAPYQVPLVIDGNQIHTNNELPQKMPAEHSKVLCNTSQANPTLIAQAIDSALAAKEEWAAMPFADRASVFLKAADLVSGKYRSKIMAATMLGQGKNIWQAEIDAAAELADFLRFNCQYAETLYNQQPTRNSAGVWNRLEHRPLEGFVYAISPFNFTAIAGNLTCAPALMGNVVVWKPSPSAAYSNFIMHEILLEAGLPPSVIQFLPGDAETVTKAVLARKEFAALHYTGSTAVFRKLYGQIAEGVASGLYRNYPRIVGETGGKNFHIIHGDANIANAVNHTVRGAFEYQGQKCSATSRVYVSEDIADEFESQLVAATKKLTLGNPGTEPHVFLGPVIHEQSYNKLTKIIHDAQADAEIKILHSSKPENSTGFFVPPTILKTTNPQHPYLNTEFFGPIVTVHRYPSDLTIPEICELVEYSGGGYGLTGSVFTKDRRNIREFEDRLKYASGNFYINCKSTGAVVGQQPFGGARGSGTNDKAGGEGFMARWVSPRSIKEEFTECTSVEYGSNSV